MQNWKRIISLVVSLAIILAITPTASIAANTEATEPAYNYVDNTEIIPLTEDEINQYSQFQLALPSLVSDHESNIEQILSHCKLVSEPKGINSSTYVYNSDTLVNYLPHASEIAEIVKLGENLFISYKIDGGSEVILEYSETALVSQTIYDPAEDTIIFISEQENMKIKSFRNGIYYELPAETEQNMINYIQDNNFDDLKSIDGISVDIDKDGTVFVSPNKAGSYKELDYLSILKSDQPPYTNRLFDNGSVYCSTLGENLKYKITETRNSYIQKKLDCKSWAAGTAITLISLYISTPLTLIEKVLAALSVTIIIQGGVEVINEGAIIANNGVYTYTGKRDGYLYDPTKYNTYVYVFQSSSSNGEFNGGYLNGEFRFIDFLKPTSFSWTSEQIKADMIFSYNKDIQAYGYCFSFRP